MPDIPTEALEVGDHAAFMMRSMFMRTAHAERVVGEVIQVDDEGFATIRVPQDGAPPMKVTAQVSEFTKVRTSPDIEAAFKRGVAAGRAQAAADIRAEAAQLEERDGVGYSYAYGFADAAEFIAPAAAVAEEGDDPTCDDANHLYPADGVRGTPCLCGKTHLQPLGVPSVDGERTDHERDLARAQLAAIHRLHERYRAAGDDTTYYCAHCNGLSGGWVPWPCPTITASSAAAARVAEEGDSPDA